MSRPVISVENLSKAYRIGRKEEVPDTLTSALIGLARAPFRRLRELQRLDTFRPSADADDLVWALKDVSFEVQEGEVLGVIGRNGAGKSTLLKILSRITEPTSGRAVIRGRVSSLLEVGTGFHPELSGRENIYLNGTILGMTKAEIDKKFDEIVDFSGVEKFLDTPIKRYSSGMKVRLAFSVAAHLEPEILIIDEVLAVGDAEFQKKCMGKMQDVARGGRTVLFVSHDMAAIEALCSAAIVLSSGHSTEPKPATQAALEYMRSSRRSGGAQICLRARPHNGVGARITEVSPLVNGVASGTTLRMGDELALAVSFESHGPAFFPVLGVVVRTERGHPLFGVNNRFINGSTFTDIVHSGTITCDLGDVPLVPGRYFVDLYLGDHYRDFDKVESAVEIDVEQTDYYGTGKLCPPSAGSVRWSATWHLSDTPPTTHSFAKAT
jgi:lipopolysaccharide transport system ATP-binding protein